MAEKLVFDDGVKEFEVNGRELLRFNPTDLNIYHRFFEVAEELPALEREYMTATRETPGPVGEDGFAGAGEALRIMRAFDAKIKERLSYVFGAENDFDRIVGGVNLMAVGKNGERIVTNVITALQPILEEGVAQHRKEAADRAVAEAKARRVQRGEYT